MKQVKIIFFYSTLFLVIISIFELSSYYVLKQLDDPHVRNWNKHRAESGLFDGIDVDILQKEQKEVYSDTDFDYYRFFRPKANFAGKYISTDKEGFRKTAQYLKQNARDTKTIVFLGGSTMWGAGTSYNWETIPSYFSKLINEKYVETNYIVENYGVGGYGNMQELIWFS